MIITLYITLLIIAFLFLLLSFFTGEYKWQGALSLLAGILFMVMGLISFNVEVIECEFAPEWEEIYIYGSNYSGYHYDHYGGDPSPSLNDLNIFHKNATYYGGSMLCGSYTLDMDNASYLCYAFGLISILLSLIRFILASKIGKRQ